MHIETIDHGNGYSTTYKEIGNTFFHINTPDEVCNVLNVLLLNKKRVKIYYGDVATGEAWIEEHDTIGTIGRSTGHIKIPLLIQRVNSSGGCSILDSCIVGIRVTASEGSGFLYRHKSLATPIVTIKAGSDQEGYTYETWANGKLYGRHNSLRSAKMCQSKIA